ncbi:MAG: AsmA family protein [Hyphomonadaceae bacterium]|nr:AsmA family protein [Hyphomonadaceae bacterium]
MDTQPPSTPTRSQALKAWAHRQSLRIQTGAHTAWSRTRALPWKPIGLWAGGAVGVLLTTLVLFLTFADWNALRGPISRMASAASGREISIRGDLDVDPWRLNPLVRVQGLHIGNPTRYRDRGEFAVVNSAEATVRWLPLFVGRLDFVRLDLNGTDISLYRNEEGISNWAPNPGVRGKPFNLPAIRFFSLNGGQLRYEDDKRRMVLEANFTTRESRDARDPGEFALTGEGSINNRPFNVELTGAPLLNVRRDRPYAFQADVTAGSTHIIANGAITRPFNFGQWHADVRATGQDLADLYPLIGLALPNTPPYNLTGRVERYGRTYAMPQIAGRVGDSDLSGNFTATRQPTDRLMLEGAFASNSLDFDDLLTVLGAPPSTQESASPEQREMAARLAAQGRVLPDAQLDISRVRNMDARVSYRAAHVRSERFPLRGLSVDINLDNGLLRLDPMTLDLRQGRVSGWAAINARDETPRAELDVRLSNARMESVLALSGEPPLTGRLMGRVRLSGSGASVRDVAANANGVLSIVTPDGEIREALAELTGINVTRGLGLLLTRDDSTTPIRCGVATFDVRNGIAHSRSILFDTKDVLIRGSGTISLRDETFDLSIQGEPKEFRLISVNAPISVGGRWRSPRIGVEAEDAIGQGGIAAALGSLLNPIAAVLPFVDAGLAEDANCASLLAGREQPAPEG